MIVLIPASQFRVTFDVGSGRPYSKFEALLLRAVAEGANSVEDLRDIFNVHPRLIIDGLVSLTREGWLAVGADGGAAFVLTASGKTTLATGRMPESRRTNTKATNVVMERISGALARNDEVRWFNDRDKEVAEIREHAVRLRPEVLSNALLEGQVERLLYRDRDEWLSSIGPIDMVTKGSWVPITVDLEARRVFGLPDNWAKLTDLLLAEASAATSRLDKSAQAMRWGAPAGSRKPWTREDDDEEAEEILNRGHQLQLRPEDLLLSAHDHHTCLRRALETAKHSLFISTATINLEAFGELAGGLRQALTRGTLVDLLWGDAVGAPSVGAVRGSLKKLAYECRRDELPGELRFNPAPSNVRANMVICDDCFGAIGSGPWAALPAVEHSAWMASVVVPRGSMLVQLMRLAAGYWSTAPGSELSSTGDRWRVMASRLEERLTADLPEPSVMAKCRAYVFGDREQAVECRDAINHAEHRVIVASSDPALAVEMLAGLAKRPVIPKEIVIVTEDSATDTLAPEHLRVLETLSVRVVRISAVGADVVAADNWVSISGTEAHTVPSVLRRNSYVLGIAIDGREIADTLIESLI